MNLHTRSLREAAQDAALRTCVDNACRRIAPTWPLDQFIAVNPWWGWTDQPIDVAAARLGCLSGARLLMPRAYYRDQWLAGNVGREHLLAAIDTAGAALSADDLIDHVNESPPLPLRHALVVDRLDDRRDLRRALGWRDFVTHQISQHCAAYFDETQATWSPDRRAGLYGSWAVRAARDHGPTLLMGEGSVARRAAQLPGTAQQLLEFAVRELGIPNDATEAYFTALLLSVNGWASWCAYLRWQARLSGGEDDCIVDLLAIRVAWEWLLLDGDRDRSCDAAWRASWSGHEQFAAQAHADRRIDWLWQAALELAYQSRLCAKLVEPSAPSSAAASVHAVFCIDVRSEVFRRALEGVAQDVRTSGFAGFFGLPIAYTPIGTQLQRPQLPGLLAPVQRATEVCISGHADDIAQRRRRALQWRERWKAFRIGASSGFTFVESLGLLYAGKLFRDGALRLGNRRAADQTGLTRAQLRRLRPALLPDAGAPPDIEALCDVTAGILRTMSLTTAFARLVLLVGHGSRSANNPHAAGLDCGACGGQTGEVNARVLAALLNDARVRRGLRERGIVIPDQTWFAAGLHNTTTDDVALFDVERWPAEHAQDLSRVRALLAQAGEAARAERAPSLGLAGLRARPRALRDAVESLADDWSAVRPEWALAGNAAFIVAPRTRTQHLDLGGRAFLHDYDWRFDPGFDVIESIMTAPMIVTHWINMQYYASTVDNARYGSGNKVLHNVVGGRLGVFEGNSGDLRIGLPMQSLHDGEAWRHTPLRLSVFIEAPPAGIERVIGKHASVRQLIDHEWLHLLRIDPDTAAVSRYRRGLWVPAK